MAPKRRKYARRPARARKHPRQTTLLTKAGTPRKRRERTFRRGKRPGRPPKPGSRLAHRTRPELASRYPVHVTWRMRAGLPNLRGPKAMRAIRASYRKGKLRFGMRLVHYSVQKNHIHMLCEALDARSLTRGLQGLAIRVAKALNRAWGRRGKVLDDRYHARILATAREVRWALGYVLCNTRRHNAQLLTPKSYPRRWLDACSSAAYFGGWAAKREPKSHLRTSEVVPAGTWLLRHGWQRAGPRLATDHVPAPRERRGRGGIKRASPGRLGCVESQVAPIVAVE